MPPQLFAQFSQNVYVFSKFCSDFHTNTVSLVHATVYTHIYVLHTYMLVKCYICTHKRFVHLLLCYDNLVTIQTSSVKSSDQS